MARFVRRLIARIRYRHFDDELRREIDVHRAMIEDDARERGASADEACYAARRQLGHVTLALLALVLAVVGTLGVFSYVISERTKEIGVRMTLGAGGRDILGMLASSVSRPLLAGAIFGLLAAQALGVVLRENLYGIGARDPLAYAAVVLILLLAAAVATFIPARRALRVDPAVTLRAD